MDKRFAIPAGLVIMVALAVIGVMSLLSFTAPRPAEASIQDTAQFNSAKVDLARLTEPLSTPLQATAAISGGAASINPVDPGAATRLQVSFTVGAAGQLVSGTGEVVITLDDDFQVPVTLDRNQITISTTEVSNSSDGCDPAVSVCAASDAAAPQSVTLELVGSENDEPQITLLVPDMIAGTNNPAIGSQGIASGSTVTVVFQQSAGIKNSTEAGTRSVKVRTTGTGDTADFSLPGVAVPMRVQMSSNGDPRNESMDLIALGVEGGTNVTFWLDLNGDGHRPNEPGFLVQPGEQDLCSVVAASSDIATCTFSVSNPPFVPGIGTDCTLPTLLACNFINAKDGDINPRTTNFPLALTQAFVDRQNFELEPTLEVSPSTANVGDRVTVSLFDYPPGDTVVPAGVTIGGVAATTISPSTVSILSNGEGNYTLTMPSGIRRGVQKINVATNSGSEQDVNLTLGGATLSISHPTVVANQDLTISGSGYTEGTGNCIPQRLITLNNIALRLDSDSVDASCNNNPSAGDVGVELSSGGTFTATVQVVAIGGTIPTALLSAGSKELKVIDSEGAEGTLNVEIPRRTMSVTPASARPRDTITIIGQNYPGDNPDTGSVSVTVEYDCGGGNQRSVTADPDASGNFRETLRIPTNCAIPSTNTVRATIGSTNTVDTVTHEIPDALVRVQPVSGPSGGVVTISGEGFRTFETVSEIEFGGRGTLGGRTVNTDGQGNFTIDDLVVPGLDPGVHAVIVRVGTNVQNRVTSSTSFEVLEASGVGGARTTPIEDALAPLFEAETLDRAFFFNNATKEWLFYINDPAFESANDLDDIPSGLPLWIRVTEDTTVELNNVEVTLSCINPGTPEEDCWNQIVFP
ncbi:MAG TPA: IPT/TIG domain-containing protein [Dehalococcoidia bacterium]|nr:IPT/TIG domain-containing protein [Dehalococcoidia bacterium]